MQYVEVYPYHNSLTYFFIKKILIFLYYMKNNPGCSAVKVLSSFFHARSRLCKSAKHIFFTKKTKDADPMPLMLCTVLVELPLDVILLGAWIRRFVIYRKNNSNS